MSEQVGKLPIRLEVITHSGLKDGKISLRFRADDGKAYEFDFNPTCAPLAALALLRHAGEADESLVQPIVVTSAQTIRFDDGAPGLILSLEGKGSLPMKFQSGDLSELIRELQNIAAPDGSGN
jgi:hypothetical protein